MRKTLIASATALTLLAAGPALASDDVPEGASAPRSEWMSKEQIARLVESKGHTVTSVIVEETVYEVEATAANGDALELYVHPMSGEILRQTVVE
ncbi:PepSY domain-containing protein [Rhodospira trueperi]|uniref:Peptidase propeptide and YPEB domain-containing protein n=1 Tax=Rhodospira trueperi TaxID=69960 RepID=A0A1G7FEM8_9PROT|nr:PepSY domain-containing protein [Rhodospira trueperi]SDE74349.1 Peptidase propeptide and YPEB domain-containing protein [Rhodospira trueperi]